MAIPFPARAHASFGDARSSPGRHRLEASGIALVVILAYIASPVPAEVARARAPVQAAPPTVGADISLDAGDEIAPHRARPTRSSRQPEPLAPSPPADGRDAPDPFILADGERYVLFTTQVGLRNVPVATSHDLRDWSPPSDALPQLPEWAAWGRTWAPGVTRLAGKYLLYFAADHQASGRQCIGVAAAADPTGPYHPTAPDPLVCQTRLGGSIDPHPFVDEDGTAHLLWKADGNAVGQPSTLFSARLRSDGMALAGEPVALLTSGTAWEQPLIENPAMVVVGGSYVLLYSGGWWESAGYAIGYAACTSPVGPCTRVTVDGPLVASAGGEAGPGGACVVVGSAGDQWLAYHSWASHAVGYDAGGVRSLRFASLTWRGDEPVVTRV